MGVSLVRMGERRVANTNSTARQTKWSQLEALERDRKLAVLREMQVPESTLSTHTTS